MKIGILSGKGGTGKTMLSVNLASTCDKALYIDCDVEEPNGHIYFKAHDIQEEDVNVKIPLIDEEKCTSCKACVDFCRFNALSMVGKKVFVFEDICHSCGACMQVCPEGAISEIDRKIGYIQRGQAENVRIYSGFLNIGYPSGVPIIKQLLDYEDYDRIFIDCPPGSSCAVMESIEDVDYCILVSEPTVFGQHNLALVHKLVKTLNKRCGLVLNKSLGGYDPSEEYAKENDLEIIGRIPFDLELGKINSEGLILVKEDQKYKEIFESILSRLEELTNV